MCEFFKGWRRKAGVVTLVMAMMLMMAWMRSHVVMDQVNFPMHGDMHQVWAEHGAVAWMNWVGGGSERHLSWHFQKPPDQSIDSFDYDQGRFRCRTLWNVWGIRIAELDIVDHRSTMGVELETHCPIWVVPYWLITIPLTLLSAYLILWKPRKRTGADHA